MSPQTTRRYATAKRIQTAAIQLALQDGLTNITTESIAHAAGVSARTFFNYYPYKEAAIMGPPSNYPVDSAEAFVQSNGRLIDDLDRLITAHLSRFLNERETLSHVLRLSETDPKLEALRNRLVLSRRNQMSELLRRRFPTENGRMLDILAGAIVAATNAATQDWALGRREDFVSVAREYLSLIFPAADLLGREVSRG